MTADSASFGSTGGNPAQPVDGSRAALTSEAGSSSDEARTHLTEHTDDDAAITTANGEPTAPQHVEVSGPTESHSAFDRTPVLHHGTGATVMNDRAAPRLIEQVRALEGDVRSAPAHTTSEGHLKRAPMPGRTTKVMEGGTRDTMTRERFRSSQPWRWRPSFELRRIEQ